MMSKKFSFGGNETFDSILAKNNILELESGYDFDKSNFSEHVKGDESMAPISINECLAAPRVTAKGFSVKSVNKKLESKMKSELENIIKENNQIDYYNQRFFQITVTKYSTGLFYEGVAESGAYFVVAEKE